MGMSQRPPTNANHQARPTLENIGQTVRRLEGKGFSTRDIIMALQTERKLVSADVSIARMDRQLQNYTDQNKVIDKIITTADVNVRSLSKTSMQQAAKLSDTQVQMQREKVRIEATEKAPFKAITDLKQELQEIRERIQREKLPQNQIETLRDEIQKKAEAARKMLDALLKEQMKLTETVTKGSQQIVDAVRDAGQTPAVVDREAPHL